MRTFPRLRLDLFKDPIERTQIKQLDDFMRQVSGGLSRSILSGQSPSANIVPGWSNPTGPPPPTAGTPNATKGDMLYGLISGAWARLAIGDNNDVLMVSNGQPAWADPSTVKTKRTFQWRANGPYQVDTEVDGGVVIPTALTITAVWLYRETAGSASSTIVDLNANGTTLYSTQANRPTIQFDHGSNKVQATLPDTTAVAAGDILTIDVDQIETGTPENLVLIVEGA